MPDDDGPAANCPMWCYPYPVVLPIALLIALAPVPQDVHAVFNEAVAEMRFAPSGLMDAPKEYWPLLADGVSLRVALLSTSEQQGFLGYANALFVADGGFDLELLNATKQGYGYSSRIDVLGRLEVRSVLHPKGLTVGQCQKWVKGFAFMAKMVAEGARAKEGARMASLPVPVGWTDPPKAVLDEERKHKFIATADLGILIDYWRLTAKGGFSGSGAAHSVPYQVDGTQLTIYQDREGRQGTDGAALIEAAFVVGQITIDRDERLLASAKKALAGWTVYEPQAMDATLVISARKRFTFREGANLGSFKQFLTDAANEMRAAKNPSWADARGVSP